MAASALPTPEEAQTLFRNYPLWCIYSVLYEMLENDLSGENMITQDNVSMTTQDNVNMITQ